MKRRQFVQSSLGGLVATRTAGLAAGLSLLGEASAAAPVKVGVLIPSSGPAGLFGPSSKNCAELAAEEINTRGGLAGRTIELLFGDAGMPPAEAAQSALKIWKGQKAEAFIGMHDSAVRGALVGLLKGEVPYVYTPTYEGGECGKGTYVLGETPNQLLAPVIPWISAQRSIKRWYLIGNDYNWPRDTNAAAKGYISAAGGSVVGEEYVPFTVDNFDSSLAKIKDSGADAVLITLVGGASVGFNRAFASFGLANKVVRLGTLIEENTLAGIGAQNSANLYSSAGYFASIDTPAARAFAARYAKKFGAQAPVLNSLAQSCYEGLLLLEAMATKVGGLKPAQFDAASEGLAYSGPRGDAVIRARHATRDIYLAQAEGAAFKVLKTFGKVESGQTCKV
jgi:urea transport system substrate-binding protein